jgi:hypothetical protein
MIAALNSIEPHAQNLVHLDAYRRRCEARPAFGRAMEGQMQTFRENAPA